MHPFKQVASRQGHICRQLCRQRRRRRRRHRGCAAPWLHPRPCPRLPPQLAPAATVATAEAAAGGATQVLLPVGRCGTRPGARRSTDRCMGAGGKGKVVVGRGRKSARVGRAGLLEGMGRAGLLEGSLGDFSPGQLPPASLFCPFHPNPASDLEQPCCCPYRQPGFLWRKVTTCHSHTVWHTVWHTRSAPRPATAHTPAWSALAFHAATRRTHPPAGSMSRCRGGRGTRRWDSRARH